MKEFKGNCIIQTMFLKGSYQGRDVDNTSDKYVHPWIEAVKEIAPCQVMLLIENIIRIGIIFLI